MKIPVSLPRIRSERLRATKRARAPAPRLPYPVFIAYSDVAAARNAITQIQRFLRAKHPNHELLPMLWRFAQLDQPRWREMALREAARAATLVIAMNANATLSPGTDAWLSNFTARQRGAVISALALVGDEAWTISLQHTATATPSIARPAANRDEPIVTPLEPSREETEVFCAA